MLTRARRHLNEWPISPSRTVHFITPIAVPMCVEAMHGNRRIVKRCSHFVPVFNTVSLKNKRGSEVAEMK